MHFRLEPDKQNTHTCPCCGNLTRKVWGYIYEHDDAYAVYYVTWTLAHVAEQGAVFELILGKWGEDSTAGDRSLATLRYRPGKGGGFMVVDSVVSDNAASSLYGHMLKRDQVIGTECAQICFDLVDAIWLGDQRIAELRDAWQHPKG